MSCGTGGKLGCLGPCPGEVIPHGRVHGREVPHARALRRDDLAASIIDSSHVNQVVYMYSMHYMLQLTCITCDM